MGSAHHCLLCIIIYEKFDMDYYLISMCEQCFYKIIAAVLLLYFYKKKKSHDKDDV
jgi:hypothetical protein